MSNMLKVMLIILICISVVGCTQTEFKGDIVSNENEFTVNFTILNTSKVHELELKKGDIITVDIESESGEIDILILDSNNKKAYQGNKVNTGSFEVKASQTGTYVIEVNGKKAKGKISFIKKLESRVNAVIINCT